MQKINTVLVLGAGSAGLIAALSLKRKLPSLSIRILRSPDIGVIGVGEGTTPIFPRHFFDYLGFSRKAFYQLAEPTWKLGIRFEWGPRGRFDYVFDNQLDTQSPGLAMPNGFYCDHDFASGNLPAALMRADKAFAKQANGCPDIQPWHAFHLENERLVSALETMAQHLGVEFTAGTMSFAEVAADGVVSAVHLNDGRRLAADFFVDASGFRSELLGKALGETYTSFGQSLFCDRAIIGGWERTDEAILPYTTAETMDAGWSWRIEHERHINRGYVYSSQFISDDQAAAEFLARNPKISNPPRTVKFRSGHYRRQWVGNVVAIGNSGGFVEPLEATALMVVCVNVQALIGCLTHTQLAPTPTIRALFNESTNAGWTDIRDFLALHYRYNTLRETPFWKHCRAETDLGNLSDFLEFYEQNGPTGFARHRLPHTNSDFGVEGYLVMMVGNQVPHQNNYIPSKMEHEAWEHHRRQLRAVAASGLTVEESLAYVRHPRWQWNDEVSRPAPARG